MPASRLQPTFTITNPITAHVLEHGSLRIQDYEALCPGVNRRSLQRDLKVMLDKGLLTAEGATNRLMYKIKEAGR